jgi:hypothetical protein
VVYVEPCRAPRTANVSVHDEIDQRSKRRTPTIEVGLRYIGERVEGNAAVFSEVVVRPA